MSEKKICPIMSGPDNVHRDDGKVECIENDCMFWQRVYTTEGLMNNPDCIKVLEPMVRDGVLRV